MILVLIFCLIAWSAQAHQANDPYADWYRSLNQPGNGYTCCSGPGQPNPDCLGVEARIGKDGYEAFIDRRFPGRKKAGWVKVPKDRILDRPDNPTGGAVACWMPYNGILCFVRGAEA